MSVGDLRGALERREWKQIHLLEAWRGVMTLLTAAGWGEPLAF